jgi:hypothetical protein
VSTVTVTVDTRLITAFFVVLREREVLLKI